VRALITGGTGFIGSRLALRCRAEGMQVLALGLRRVKAEAENAAELAGLGVEVREVPVSDPAALAAAMRGVDVVFHLAAAQHEANVPDEYFRAINVDGTRNVLEAALSARVARVVHASTIGVYRWRPGDTVSESTPLEPDHVYGITKLAGEQVVREYMGRLPCAIARISETYGPGDRRLLKLYAQAQRGFCLQIGGGANLHHLVFIDDLVTGLLLAARSPSAPGRSFVLAGPEAVTSRAMLEAVLRSLDRDGRILPLPLAPLMAAARALEGVLRPLGVQPPLHPRRMDFFRRSFAFTLEEAKELGYQPRVGLDEGMQETAQWYLERGLVSAERQEP
jgi:nucleoside-diphosphate-sugar epimerase